MALHSEADWSYYDDEALIAKNKAFVEAQRAEEARKAALLPPVPVELAHAYAAGLVAVQNKVAGLLQAGQLVPAYRAMEEHRTVRDAVFTQSYDWVNPSEGLALAMAAFAAHDELRRQFDRAYGKELFGR